MKDKVWIDEINSPNAGEDLREYNFSKKGHQNFLVLYADETESSSAIVKILKAFNEDNNNG